MSQRVEDDLSAIEAEDREPTFYARIPKMAIMDLAPYELALYCHYREIIGSNESDQMCWMSNANLAARAQMSVSRMKEARNTLRDLGYIRVRHEPNPHSNSEMAIVTVRNIWALNHNRFMTQKEFETGIPLDPSRQKTGGGRQKTTPQPPENHKEEPIKNNQEEIKDGLPVVATGKRRNDWRGNTPIAPSGEASTTNEGKAYRSLELYLLKAIQKQKLTDPQREALWGTVRVLSRETSNAYPSPVDLYDDNEQFKVFAEEKINSIVNSSNGKSGATAIVNALRGYEHPNGWLAYQLKQGGPVTPERSSETPSEPVKSGFVPGERFKL